VLTIPGLIAGRWGEGWPRGISAAILVVGSLATLAVQIKALAVIGHGFLPLPGWSFAAGILVLTLAYTATGGMRPGLHIEAGQGVIMGLTALGLSAAALGRAGFWSGGANLGELRAGLLDPMASGKGGHFLGLFLLFAVGTCAQPHYLQKFLMLKNRSSLRFLPVVSTVALLSILSIWAGFGLAGAVLAAGGRIHFSSPDALAPALLEFLGFPLLPIALLAVLAAVMSTSATLLNLVAAAFSVDFPEALSLPGTGSEEGRLRNARKATLLAAMISALLALASGRSVIMLGIFGWGFFTAAFLPVMVLGLRSAAIGRRAAIAALVSGPLVQLGLEILHSRGLLLRWEPGLSGAAIGMLVLSLWKEPVAEAEDGKLLSSP